MKLFADLERKRQKNEQKISDDAFKKRTAELEAEEKRNKEKEYQKNWEESRQGRVNSWMSFQKGGGSTQVNACSQQSIGKCQFSEPSHFEKVHFLNPFFFN